MKSGRLLEMLLLLQARGRVTAAELAVRLEVSPRTVYRDAEALSAAGVPLYGDAGHAGGYQLLFSDDIGNTIPSGGGGSAPEPGSLGLLSVAP